MAKVYDVVAITGKYTNQQGEEKARYMNCGVVIEKDGRLSLKLEGLPVGGEWNGWLSLFTPRPQGQQPSNNAPQRPQQYQHMPAQGEQPYKQCIDPFADNVLVDGNTQF